jgi:23S rRNA (uracil1939-C5)-methyltransferase
MSEAAAPPETGAVLELGPFDRHGITRAWIPPAEGEPARLVEVEHGIPGETVRVELSGRKRLHGKILEVLDPSPDRVQAPCPYFREWSCGGCQWQMIDYAGQVARKRADVEAAMQAVGLDLIVDRTHTLDDPWRYRTTAGIALGKRAGFRRRASLAIVPIRDCPISHPLIGRLMAELNDRLDAGTLPDFRGRVRLDARLAEGADGDYLQVLIRIEEGRPEPADLAALANALARLEFVGSVLREDPAGRPEAVEVVAGEEFGTITVAGRPMTVTPGAFFQTNLRLLPELIGRIVDEARPLRGLRVADVYGGVGLFGLAMAGEAAEAVVLETDLLAVAAGERTAGAWGLENVRYITGDAGDTLFAAGPFDVVVVDPPRSGLSAPVLEALAGMRPPLILYVSCLAESLARDLAVLTEAGYRVHGLELFDFYPQTYHVELLAVLRR